MVSLESYASRHINLNSLFRNLERDYPGLHDTRQGPLTSAHLADAVESAVEGELVRVLRDRNNGKVLMTLGAIAKLSVPVSKSRDPMSIAIPSFHRRVIGNAARVAIAIMEVLARGKNKTADALFKAYGSDVIETLMKLELFRRDVSGDSSPKKTQEVAM